MRNHSKIKICFFSPASYAFIFEDRNAMHGGAELQMYLLAKKLSEISEFEISFFIANYGQDKIEYVDNIKLIRSFKLLQKENVILKMFKAIKYVILLIKHEPDVIITTTANIIVGITAFSKKLINAKHIHRTASIIDVDGSFIKKSGFNGKIYKKGLETADIVITQSKEHQLLLEKNHFITALILKNAINIEQLVNQAKDGILWVGKYSKMKQPELYISLAKSLSNINFTMICSYNQEDFNDWKKLKHRAESLPNLTFIEKVAYEKIQEYFNKAALFVNTSTIEGFPNTFLQAAMSKTPIVSLNVNPDDFLTEFDCGIFCKNNFEKLVQSTQNLLQNRDELQVKGKNAYKYLKENHDINVISKKLSDIILSL